MSEAQVLYVADVARILGRTEASVRTAVNRARASKKWPAWLPPIMKDVGHRLQWYRPTVDAHLQARASVATKKGGAK